MRDYGYNGLGIYVIKNKGQSGFVLGIKGVRNYKE
jgi:hypothetical protein